MRIPVDIACVKFKPLKDLPEGMLAKAVYSHPLNIRDGDTLKAGLHLAIVWRPLPKPQMIDTLYDLFSAIYLWIRG